MPKSITLQSPAKINLYLRVKNKRKDGYHNIVTIFERIDLCDELTFSENRSGKILISCNRSDVPIGAKNLVHRVIRLVKERYNINKGVNVRLKKVIPVAAGLAGGSSNAATALLALNRLWQLKLDKEAMVELAKKIGSDVAFFIHQCSWGLGTGRGDQIQPLNISKKFTHILVVPCVKLYASEVYGALKFKLTAQKDNVNILIHHLENNNYDVSSLMLNDLESPIIKLKPGLKALKKRLNSLGTQGVMISGSGPAVFGLTKDIQQATRLKRILERRYAQVFVVKTL